MKDPIERQDAIDAVRHAWAKGLEPTQFLEELPPAQPEVDCQKCVFCGFAGFKQFQTALQWIPCTERLPEEETDVIVCNANGDIEISRGSYSTEMNDYFIWYTTGWRFGEVIAWMPLPKPPKEGDE